MSSKWECINAEGHLCNPGKKQCCDSFECKRMAYGPSGADTVHACVPKDVGKLAAVGHACGANSHCSTGYCHKRDCAGVEKVFKGACQNTRGVCAIQTTLSRVEDFHD